MIASGFTRFSTVSPLPELIASRLRRHVRPVSLGLSVGSGLPPRVPVPRAEPTRAGGSADALQAEIDALEDPERWDGLA